MPMSCIASARDLSGAPTEVLMPSSREGCDGGLVNSMYRAWCTVAVSQFLKSIFTPVFALLSTV